MEELLLIKILLTKDDYLKYKKYLDNINLELEPKAVLESVSLYFEEYPEVESITIDELKTYFYMKYPNYKGRDSFEVLFYNLETLNINNEDLLNKVLNNLIERYFASDIVESLTQVLSGSKYGILSDVETKLKEYYDVSSKADGKSPFVEESLVDLLTEEVLGEGLRWRLDCLNQDVGDLRGGSLGHIYARPDTGKTTFLSDQVTNFAKQIKDDEIIAWFNNEEKGTKVKLRIYSSLLGLTKDEIAANPEKAEADFKAAGGDKIKIYDSAVISVPDIEAILKQYKVRLIVVDQGDKVKFRGGKDLATHERLKVLYGIFRELGKEYNCDIITAGQASAQGEGVKWLSLDMMDNSRTGKPGELDYAIAIGFSSEEGKEALRFIHVAKNKMKNGVHGKHVVRFDAVRARYNDITYEVKDERISVQSPVPAQTFSVGSGAQGIKFSEIKDRGIY